MSREVSRTLVRPILFYRLVLQELASAPATAQKMSGRVPGRPDVFRDAHAPHRYDEMEAPWLCGEQSDITLTGLDCVNNAEPGALGLKTSSACRLSARAVSRSPHMLRPGDFPNSGTQAVMEANQPRGFSPRGEACQAPVSTPNRDASGGRAWESQVTTPPTCA